MSREPEWEVAAWGSCPADSISGVRYPHAWRGRVSADHKACVFCGAVYTPTEEGCDNADRAEQAEDTDQHGAHTAGVEAEGAGEGGGERRDVDGRDSAGAEAVREPSVTPRMSLHELAHGELAIDRDGMAVAVGCDHPEHRVGPCCRWCGHPSVGDCEGRVRGVPSGIHQREALLERLNEVPREVAVGRDAGGADGVREEAQQAAVSDADVIRKLADHIHASTMTSRAEILQFLRLAAGMATGVREEAREEGSPISESVVMIAADNGSRWIASDNEGMWRCIEKRAQHWAEITEGLAAQGVPVAWDDRGEVQLELAKACETIRVLKSQLTGAVRDHVRDVERVRKLHVPEIATGERPTCYECGIEVLHPCATIRALDGGEQ